MTRKLLILGMLYLFWSCNNADIANEHETIETGLSKIAWPVGNQMKMHVVNSGQLTEEPNLKEETFGHDTTLSCEISVLEKLDHSFVLLWHDYNSHIEDNDSVLYSAIIREFQHQFFYIVEVDAYGCLIEIQNIEELLTISMDTRLQILDMGREHHLSEEVICTSIEHIGIPETKEDILRDFESKYGLWFGFYKRNIDLEKISPSYPDALHRITEERTEKKNGYHYIHCKYKSKDGNSAISESIKYNYDSSCLESYSRFTCKKATDSTFVSNKTEYSLVPCH